MAGDVSRRVLSLVTPLMSLATLAAPQFPPRRAILALKAYVRHRHRLAESVGTYVQQMLKGWSRWDVQPQVALSFSGRS
jgi:hypothetical protein